MGAEKDISLISGQAVIRVLKNLGLACRPLEAGPDLPRQLQEYNPDAAFLAVHGKYAEDGIVQGLCEYLKIPYTGSGVLASSVCMDKCFLKDLFTLYHIKTPPYQNWKIKEESPDAITLPEDRTLPLVVKPSREGSSLGISICHTEEEFAKAIQKARQYDTDLVIESYIKGQELALSFLNGQFLTPVEIAPKTGFYDYKNKYTTGATEYILPPRVPASVIKQCQKNTQHIIQALSIRTYCRADFIIQDNTAWMMEINTLPGLTPHSLLPKSAKHDGIDFKTVILTILKGAGLDYETRD